ncbi:MAG: DinB family protein [Bacteroidetes bacterium]|nr:DinB family protein [Bacteroidota bacterium]
MTIISLFQQHLQREAIATRKMLAIVPTDKFGWKPHEKSMTIKTLATHIADIFAWFDMVINHDELDFAKNPYQQDDINSAEELMALFEKDLAKGTAALASAKESTLPTTWTMRNGEQVYISEPKADVLWMCFGQIIHHRAQLGVFLRLLNIPIPGPYGPSADEMAMM